MLPPKITQFIKLAGGDPASVNSGIFFFELVSSFKPKRTLEKEMELINYVKKNPELLTMHICKDLVFDFFFDKLTKVSHSVKIYDFWLSALIDMIEIVKTLDDAEYIFENKTYIYRVQSGIQNHDKLFDYLINYTDFVIDDPEYLVYSIIARGELEKLKILNKQIDISNYIGIYDVAVKYGRSVLVRYMRFNLNIDPTEYGKILDFANYTPNHRYIYYKTGLASFANSNAGNIINAKQDYPAAVNNILDVYKYPVTIETLDIWADVARSKRSVYKWDHLDFGQIVEVFRPYLAQSIPLSHDFGDYNYEVFGREWSDRKCIIEYCMRLEDQNEELQEKYNLLLNKYYDAINCSDDLTLLTD